VLDIKKLNKEQKEAVVHEEDPLLIVAGAGTGKTTVITQRVAYLIQKNKAEPEEILAVTFTEKAAEEMEERVDVLLPYGYVDLWVSTFHSFCERILEEHGLDIGLPGDFKILDQTAAWMLVRKNLEEFDLKYYKPRGNPTRFIHALINHFARCKDQGIYPEDYLEYGEELKTNLTDLPETEETERIKEVANAYHVYQKLLLENSVLDFGDLINYCLKLFNERPHILQHYREKFKYILVDEFQDTNWAQYELVKTLAAPDNNLTVCADDDQAIYRWRGASFNNIIQFKKDFPKAKEVFLIKNYRSRQNILDLSYKFIKANDPNRLEHISKVNKQLVSQKEGGGEIEHLHFNSLQEETRGVVNKIKKLLEKDKEAGFSDFAVLVRANDSAKPFTLALERAGIPYRFLASRGLYSKPIILDIISYFKLLDNYHENSAVYRVLNLPFLDIATDDIMKINEYCRKKTKTIYEALQELPLIPGLSSQAVDSINFLLSLIKKHTQLSKEKSVSEVFLSFLKESGYLQYLNDQEKIREFDLINQFYKRVKEFEESSLDPLLPNFMEQLNLELESGEQGDLEFDIEQGPDMVRVMTVHSAKGLEFKYVFIVNAVKRRFPTTKRKDPIEIPEKLIKDVVPEGDVHLQEERRLFYVAMTRAKKGLFFTSAEDYGGKRKKKISRFLVELGFEKLKRPEQKKIELTGEKIKNKTRMDLKLPTYFSFSQLVAFEKCPLQYKFAHILKIPMRGKAVFSFGKSIHNTLHDFVKVFHQESKREQSLLFGGPGKKEKPEEEKKVLTYQELLDIYERDWIDEWYKTPRQKQEYYQLGKKILKDFYEEFIENPPDVLVRKGELGLEIPFKLKIGDDLLIGRIDRIDKIEGGVEVIDYKTGKFKEKLSSSNKQQLLIYQIASEQALGLSPVKLSYYYLEEGGKTSFIGTQKDKEKQKEKIMSEIKEINKSDFGPTPGWHCKYCDFRDICSYAQN